MKKLTLAIVAVVFAFGLSTVRAEETAKKEEAAKPATSATAPVVEKKEVTAIPAGKAEEKKADAKAEVKKEGKKAEAKKEDKKEDAKK